MPQYLGSYSCLIVGTPPRKPSALDRAAYEQAKRRRDETLLRIERFERQVELVPADLHELLTLCTAAIEWYEALHPEAAA